MAPRQSALEVGASGRQDALRDTPGDARRGGVLTAQIAYVDASALAKLFLGERESDALSALVAGDLTLTSSLLVRVEVWRALLRAGVAEATFARARGFLERVHLRRLSDEILARAAEVTPRPLRALDAIHLATALDLSPPPDFVLCYDERFAAAARWHGLAVRAPGADEVDEP